MVLDGKLLLRILLAGLRELPAALARDVWFSVKATFTQVSSVELRRWRDEGYTWVPPKVRFYQKLDELELSERPEWLDRLWRS